MDFLPPTRANERAMLAAFADARLIVFVKIAGDGIGHRSDNQRAAVSERTKLIRLQQPKSLHRHLDQRVGQSLCRGLLEPLFQVFGERRQWEIMTKFAVADNGFLAYQRTRRLRPGGES